MATGTNLMNEDRLKVYIPDVYQYDIMGIDYKLLKAKGIKLLSFDIDDTIPGAPSKEAIILFAELKRMGFVIELTSNNHSEHHVKKFAKKLGIAENYTYKAHKPSPMPFEALKEKYGYTENEIAHIGNSIMNDVGGAKASGFITCLVRGNVHGRKIVKALEERGLWHKHHVRVKADQYYQLGEIQKYNPIDYFID